MASSKKKEWVWSLYFMSVSFFKSILLWLMEFFNNVTALFRIHCVLWGWHHQALFQVWWCNNCWVSKCCRNKSSCLNLILAKWFGEGGQLAQRAYLLKYTDETKTHSFTFSRCVSPHFLFLSHLTLSYMRYMEITGQAGCHFALPPMVCVWDPSLRLISI